MPNKKINILTTWGDSLGFGHIQRMTSLLWHLNDNGYPVSITLQRIPDYFPYDLRKLITDTVPSDTDLIIRDMRDSTEEQIRWCKQVSPVLVLDDRGPGKEEADFSFELLPYFDTHNSIDSILRSFIYGYSFTQGMNCIQNHIIEKTIDVAIYIGSEPERSLVDKVISLIPAKATALLLSNKGLYKIHDGTLFHDSSLHYAEILMTSKTLITHFGITLFEGFATRCRLITINPSSYHSRLTENIKNSLCIHNLGTFQTIDEDIARMLLLAEIKDPICINIRPAEVRQAITASINNFIQYLQSAVLSHLP